MIKTSLFIISLLALSLSTALAQPKIKVEEGTTLDFGDVYTGLKAEKVLTIRNIGKDTLRISEVKAQCGCTAAMMKDEDKMIPPSGSGKLSISFNTQNYGGQKVTKQVYITSNDTSNARVTVSFNVNVVSALDLNPKFFSFDNAKLDTTITKTITITNPSKEAVKIISINTTFDQIKLDLMKKQLMPGESTQLQATFHPTKSGTTQGDIDILTDNKMQSKFQVKFYTWVNRK